jgi:hypothetical protein
MLELVADLDNLMLIHVKIVSRIIVPCKLLDEADGFGLPVGSCIHTRA